MCIKGMTHNKIHIIRPGCPLPSIALQMPNRGLKHHSFNFIYPKRTDSGKLEIKTCQLLFCDKYNTYEIWNLSGPQFYSEMYSLYTDLWDQNNYLSNKINNLCQTSFNAYFQVISTRLKVVFSLIKMHVLNQIINIYNHHQGILDQTVVHKVPLH